MESLKEGSEYELQASAAGFSRISVVHVKLTDTSLKAIEEFDEWIRKSKVSKDVSVVCEFWILLSVGCAKS
jgi:hypothetical protein